MRSRRRFWWAIRLALGAYVVVSGCATSGTLPDLEGLPGKIAGQAGRRGVVIAAPHGSSDARTGEIAAELGRRTGFGVVVATGFSLDQLREYTSLPEEKALKTIRLHAWTFQKLPLINQGP